MHDFTGKVVAVTGSNRGIGRAIASHFISLGASVAVTARNLEQADRTAKELGGDARPFALDVNDSTTVDAAFKAILDAWGKIDVLVNNAGITRDGLAMRMKNTDWSAVLESNLTGAFSCIQAVLRPMVKARNGAVVNISSVVASMGNPGQPNYCAAKAGMEGLTRSLAREYSGKGLRFNCVAPGFIVSDMTDALNEKQKGDMISNIPSGRLGTGEDIARAAAFLASDNASYITGQVLHVNGGMYMG